MRDEGGTSSRPGLAAQAALLRIGRPALKAVEAATRDPDAERVRRATDLVDAIRLLPDPAAVDRNCTNGYTPASDLAKQIQTFTAGTDADVDVLRVRAARTYGFLPRSTSRSALGTSPRASPWRPRRSTRNGASPTATSPASAGS